MISDITLGQFFPGVSILHRLDPRTKIILSVLFIVTVFLANNPVSFLLIFLATLWFIMLSRIAISTVLRGIKPILAILIFTAAINIFFIKGQGEPLVSLWVIEIYTDGIIKALFMALRVTLLIMGTSVLLTYTTSPISLTDGIESLLSPLKKIGVPVHVFAMMMSIALRFIPTLVEETEKIMNAQKSRGADFESGGLIKRARSLIPLLIPLFVSAFTRAEELATAMECRCYRGDKNRTKLNKLQYKKRDFVIMGVVFLILGAVIALRVIPAAVSLDSTLFDIIFYTV